VVPLYNPTYVKLPCLISDIWALSLSSSTRHIHDAVVNLILYINDSAAIKINSQYTMLSPSNQVEIRRCRNPIDPKNMMLPPCRRFEIHVVSLPFNQTWVKLPPSKPISDVYGAASVKPTRDIQIDPTYISSCRYQINSRHIWRQSRIEIQMTPPSDRCDKYMMLSGFNRFKT